MPLDRKNSHITSPIPRKPKLVSNLSVKGGGLRKEISLDLSSSFSSALQPSANSQGVHLSLPVTWLLFSSAGTNGQAPMTTQPQLAWRLHWHLAVSTSLSFLSLLGDFFLALPPYPFSNAPASHGSVAIHLQLYSFVCSTASLPSQEPGSHS